MELILKSREIFIMNNKEKLKKILLLVTIAITLIGLAAFWFTFKMISPDISKITETKNNVEVNKTVYDKITSPEKFGTDVSPNEEGYGREDPFAPY